MLDFVVVVVVVESYPFVVFLDLFQNFTSYFKDHHISE